MSRLRIAREFEGPTVVALKHMNPCGIGQADNLEKAWDLAYAVPIRSRSLVVLSC